MPWKTKSKPEQRYELVRAMLVREASAGELCQHWGVSRKTAYKWFKRYKRKGLRGLYDQSTKPARVPSRTDRYWVERLRRLRKKRPTWGARKLHHRLGKRHGTAGLPSVATLGRWLKRLGLARGRHRRPPGPVVVRPRLRPAQHANQVWTVDFKGWYRTGNGQRVDPLTVRDLYSRYGLAIVLLRSQRAAETRRAFVKIFRQYGLPERIRCDNGAPFGGGGPTGLTRLSAWWVKLGIEVEFITPGRPCENGAHEQFHRVYKAEAVRHPAWSRAAQQRRSHQWLRHYNQERSHEALGMEVPASIYRKSQRRLPAKLEQWTYSQGWSKRWVKGNGEFSWRGKHRYVGEAFVRDYVGLKPVRKEIWRVYFGTKLVGVMDEKECGSIRMARYQTRRKGAAARHHSGSLRSPP